MKPLIAHVPSIPRRIVVGVDSHKKTHTAVAVSAGLAELGMGLYEDEISTGRRQKVDASYES